MCIQPLSFWNVKRKWLQHDVLINREQRALHSGCPLHSPQGWKAILWSLRFDIAKIPCACQNTSAAFSLEQNIFKTSYTKVSLHKPLELIAILPLPFACSTPEPIHVDGHSWWWAIFKNMQSSVFHDLLAHFYVVMPKKVPAVFTNQKAVKHLG